MAEANQLCHNTVLSFTVVIEISICLGIFILNFILSLDLTSTVYGITLMKMIFYFTGRFAVSTSLALLYVYTSELFPTEIRSKGLGVSLVSTRCGSLLAPFVALLVSAAIMFMCMSGAYQGGFRKPLWILHTN